MGKIVKVTVTICASLVGVVAAVVLTFFITSIPHPSDHQMKEEFFQNQNAFNALLVMIQHEPHVTRVGGDFIWVDGARTLMENDPERSKYLTDARWQRYHALFRELHVLDIGRRDDGSVILGRSSWGLVVGGWEKDFYWSRAPVDHPLALNSGENVDESCGLHNGDCDSYKQLAPDWYIEFERN